MGSAIQHLDEDKAKLAAVIRGFSSRATESRKLIRGMLEQDRDRLYAAAVEILKAPDDSRGYRYLIALLMGRDMLLEALSERSWWRCSHISDGREITRMPRTGAFAGWGRIR